MHRDILLCPPPETLWDHCSAESFQGSGPGGQHRNKTATGIRLRYTPFNLEILCCDERHAHLNRQRALKRMALAIALRWRLDATPDIIAFPGQNGRLSSENLYFPLFVAQALDQLEAHRGDLRPVSALWQLTPSALWRILSQEKSVRDYVQNLRRQHGKPPLHPPG